MQIDRVGRMHRCRRCASRKELAVKKKERKGRKWRKIIVMHMSRNNPLVSLPNMVMISLAVLPAMAKYGFGRD